MVKESDPAISNCFSELAPLLQLQNVSYKSLEEEIDTIGTQLGIVSKEIKMIDAYKEHPSYNQALDGKFIDKLTEFHKDSSSKVQFLRQELKLLSEQVKSVLKFFGEEQNSKMTAEVVIDYVTRFMNAFEVNYGCLILDFISSVLQAG
jgi:Formin Homology 2 Domain